MKLVWKDKEGNQIAYRVFGDNDTMSWADTMLFIVRDLMLDEKVHFINMVDSTNKKINLQEVLEGVLVNLEKNKDEGVSSYAYLAHNTFKQNLYKLH